MRATPLTDTLLPALGLALRVLRDQRKMRQAELARRAGMGKSQVSLYENGKQAPNFESLLRILAGLGCDFHDLYNALQVAERKLDQVCSMRKGHTEEVAIQKIAEGLALLLKALRLTS
jgi:transcriptional regulator with XRE-family HTH domain